MAVSRLATDLAPPLGIYTKLHAVMQEVDYIQKEKKQGMRYSIVTHDAVTAKVRPIMVKHGVLYYPASLTLNQQGNRTECQMVVRFVSVEDGSSIDVHSAGYGIDDQDKGPGKAISYAVKYALLKALGLESGDDPDVEQDVVHEPQQVLDIRRYIEALTDLAQAEDLTEIGDMIRTAHKDKKIDKAQAQGLGQELAAKAKKLGIEPARKA